MAMVKTPSSLFALPLFLAFSLLPGIASASQPVTNKTISDQLVILEERLMERLDNLSTRISALEAGNSNAASNPADQQSVQSMNGKFEEFSFILTNLQQQVESISKANQKSVEMLQQELGKTSKDSSGSDKELSYQISAIKLALQDISYKLYQTEDILKRKISAIQEKVGAKTEDEPSYPPLSNSQPPKEEQEPVADAEQPEKKERKPMSAVSSSASMEDSYKNAYNDYLRQNYAMAIISFNSFLKNFPDTSLSDNAQYWVGECYYSQKKMPEAIAAFEDLIKKYPKSNKILEAKYKIARSYHEMGNNIKALEVYEAIVAEAPDSAISDRSKEYIKSIKEQNPATP